jgi:isovaleryl-CoA dehydrogenase
MRGSDTGELCFEDCEVPAENMLGNEGEGVYVLMKGLDYERLILSAGPLGIMQASVDLSLRYATEREQFGKKLGEFQILQAKIADMYAMLQSSRAYLYSSATMFDAGIKSNVDSAAIYLHTSRYGVRCAEECI